MKLTDRGERLMVTVLLVLTGLVLVGAGWLGQEWKQDRLVQHSGQTCFEDEPCWNCEEMGNGVCGDATR
jgi:hypothetical protein